MSSTACFQSTGQAGANWALGTFCSWEEWKEVFGKVEETGLYFAPLSRERGAW